MSITENSTLKRTKTKSIISELEKEDNKIKKTFLEKRMEGKFSKEIFERLPKLIKIGCNTLVDEIEKEVFLVGSLGIISGLLPNVYTEYDGQAIYPNLYVAVLGKFGSGKGALKFAKLLAKDVREEILNKEQYLFIPANNSKTGIIESLEQNGSRGIIFETEASTLATAMKSEHGKFKDVLLRSFHHEENTFYRSTEKRRVIVEEPKLSCVLSSTPGQFRDFIPSMEDGLYSRFIYYYTSASKVEFRDVFNLKKRKYKVSFEKLSKQFKNLYTQLESLEKPVFISLKKAHQKKFVQLFDKWTKFFHKQINEDLAGAVFRIAVINYRIMMIFAVLRFFEKQSGKKEIKIENIEVQDIDFSNSLEITEKLIWGSLEMYDMMPERRKKAAREKKETMNKKQKDEENKKAVAEVKLLINEGLTPVEIQMKLRINRGKYYKLRKLIKEEEKEKGIVKVKTEQLNN